MCPTDALDDIRTAQAKQNLLYIIRRQLLERGDLASRHRSLLGALRKVQRADHPVLSPCRNSHVCTIRGATASNKSFLLFRTQPASIRLCSFASASILPHMTSQS